MESDQTNFKWTYKRANFEKKNMIPQESSREARAEIFKRDQQNELKFLKLMKFDLNDQVNRINDMIYTKQSQGRKLMSQQSTNCRKKGKGVTFVDNEDMKAIMIQPEA